MLRSASLLAFAVVVAGCAGAPQSTSPETAPQTTQPPGASVFKRECASCHGARGEGMGHMPAVMGSGALAGFETAADVHAFVSKEMPLPKSKAGTLSPDDYWALVSFMLVRHGVAVPSGGITAENAASVPLR